MHHLELVDADVETLKPLEIKPQVHTRSSGIGFGQPPSPDYRLAISNLASD